jgi:hypothetical protein
VLTPGCQAIVAEDASQHIRFHTTYAHDVMTSVSSLTENGERNEVDLCDFSIYMDQVRFSVEMFFHFFSFIFCGENGL